MLEKISINNVNQFTETILKYLNYFLSVLATQPKDDKYQRVNLKNDALLVALGIGYKMERGLKTRLMDDYEFVFLTKKGRYNNLTNTRSCDLFYIDFFTVCNFITALTICRREFIELPAIEILSHKTNLPSKVKEYFQNYSKKRGDCLIKFEKGKQFDMKIVDNKQDERTDIEMN